MAHLALYREFRPQTFDDVIGQEQIVQTLKNQIKTNTISHAYLFCGTRGTGKTSCAKIFARAVNCQTPKDGSPCGKCDICQKIQANGNLDIVEIDAASNNRVDEIRDLRDKVGYLPNIAKYKVYIIDEVHMLTDSAFNALLKTLEEPPAHVIFILATTEPEKLPATILSRCMRFNFKLVGVNALVELLKKIFAKTNTKYEEKSLELIAKSGRGSVRDTLSVAEMCKSFSADNITTQSVTECLGLTDETTLFQLSESIVLKQGSNVLSIVEKLFDSGKNLTVLIDDLCDYFKDILTKKLDNSFNFNLPSEIVNHYQTIADECDEKYLLDALKILCESQCSIKFCTNDKVFCETALLSIFYDDNLQIEMLKQKIDNLEKALQNGDTLQKKTENIISQKNTPIFDKSEKLSKLNDTLQQKRKIDENKTNEKQNLNANKIFGELITYCRNNNEFMLLSSLNDIKTVDYIDGQFVLQCLNDGVKTVVDEHKYIIEQFLKQNYQIANLKIEVYVDKFLEKEKKLAELLDGKLKIE